MTPISPLKEPIALETKPWLSVSPSPIAPKVVTSTMFVGFGKSPLYPAMLQSAEREEGITCAKDKRETKRKTSGK